VGNGDGTIASANVTNINVVCGPAPGKFLYATYDDPVILRGYTINAITGGLSLIGGSAAPSGSNVSALTASPSGQFLYTANTALGSISGYSINQITGSLTEISGSPFAAATNLAALTFRPDGTFAYAPYYQNFVAAFSVNATTGALTLLGGSPYTVGIQPGEAVIDPTGKFIYVPSGGSQELYGFAIHPTEGTLAAVPGSPYTSMRQRDLKIWVGASATILYVSNASTGAIPNDSSVSAYQINPSTGQLSEIMGSPFGDGTAGGRIRISADNRFLFIAGTNSNGGAAISSFSIHQTTGALTLVPPVPTPAVGSPNSIQVGNVRSPTPPAPRLPSFRSTRRLAPWAPLLLRA
jgi:DNA-binding beta-propeller fold protein YncE